METATKQRGVGGLLPQHIRSTFYRSPTITPKKSTPPSRRPHAYNLYQTLPQYLRHQSPNHTLRFPDITENENTKYDILLVLL